LLKGGTELTAIFWYFGILFLVLAAISGKLPAILLFLFLFVGVPMAIFGVVDWFDGSAERQRRKQNRPKKYKTEKERRRALGYD
jgi:phosphatidylglycerophosphate synthase